MPRLIRSLITDERAASAVEYGLIIALIVLAIVSALASVADATIGLWTYVTDTVVGS